MIIVHIFPCEVQQMWKILWWSHLSFIIFNISTLRCVEWQGPILDSHKSPLLGQLFLLNWDKNHRPAHFSSSTSEMISQFGHSKALWPNPLHVKHCLQTILKMIGADLEEASLSFDMDLGLEALPRLETPSFLTVLRAHFSFSCFSTRMVNSQTSSKVQHGSG